MRRARTRWLVSDIAQLCGITATEADMLKFPIFGMAVAIGLGQSPAGAADHGTFLRNVSANLVLDVIGAQQGNGHHLTIYPRSGANNQIFELQDIGGSRYKIVARHSGKCLDVLGGSQQDGAAIGQWDCNGGPNQQWRLVVILEHGPCSGLGCLFAGTLIQSVHSQKCLDVANPNYPSPPKKDALVQQWSCARDTGDRWWVNQTWSQDLLQPPPGPH
jgi:hypothetical protein